MQLIKPPMLQPGDTLAAITLSWGGARAIPNRYNVGKNQLETVFNVRVIETKHALHEPAWIYANPQARADDLMEAFSNPNINGIVSIIGGDDSIRLLDHLDLKVIRQNPKVFLGYSDTTVTHFACLQAGLSSFSGPSIMSGFAENGGLHDYLEQSVRRTLFSSRPIGKIEPNTDGWTVERLAWENADLQNQKRKLQPYTGWNWLQGDGIVQGHLIGGCLEIVDLLRGTSIFPSLEMWQDAILFLETSEEMPSPQQVKYFLRSLAAIGLLQRLSGLLLGRPGGQIPPEQFIEYDQAVLTVVRDENGLTHLPIITNMDFGHTDPMFVIPMGMKTQIDCEHKELTMLENAVEQK
jgi:muramoyltetrapeptide carboxypeptidase LdcA involved in peptidoglycan recycling